MSDDPSLGQQVSDSLHGFVEGVGRMIGVDVNAPDPDEDRVPERGFVSGAVAHLVGAAPTHAPRRLAAPMRRAWEITQHGDGTATLGNGVESVHCKSLAFAEAVRSSLHAITNNTRGRR